MFPVKKPGLIRTNPGNISVKNPWLNSANPLKQGKSYKRLSAEERKTVLSFWWQENAGGRSFKQGRFSQEGLRETGSQYHAGKGENQFSC
jgi:hypothetical protein